MSDPKAESAPSERESISPEEKFLRAFLRVLRDKAMYPEHHPQVLSAISNLQGTIEGLFTERQERTFVFIDDQVFVDDRLLTHTQTNPSDVVKVFREKRVDALILRQGLSWDEFCSFLDHLTISKLEGSQKQVFHSPHVDIGDLSPAAAETAPAVSPVIQDLGAAISRSALNKACFEDESKIMQDIYTDWGNAQEALVSLVDRVMHALEQGLFTNYQSFIPLGELKSYDEYTYVHAINLAILTMALAESIGCSREDVHAFGVGSLLHDVGKTQVSVNVLHKQGQLTPEEFEEMKKHPIRGAATLLQYPEIPPVAAIVAYEHHLKYDGTGYPTMKQQRKQHLASRLTAIADQFDAMRSNRPYREAMPPEKILEIMQQSRGTGLDPELLDHFIAFMKPRKII
jgi:putative nucleotidyltransferase with HDIG domain